MEAEGFESLLNSLSKKDIDSEIAKRLKYSQGTVDEFIDTDELDKLMANAAMSDTYILGRIDKTGNQGKQARRLEEKKNFKPKVEVKTQKTNKQVYREQTKEPMSVLTNEEDLDTRRAACKQLIKDLIVETKCDFLEKEPEIPSLLASLKQTIYTQMISRLGNKDIERKLLVFEYLCALIDWIRDNKTSTYNYNRIAERMANEFKVSRKEKEIVVDLLDSYYPTKKADFGEIGSKIRRAGKNKEKSTSPQNRKAPLSKSSHLAVAGGELVESRYELLDSSARKPGLEIGSGSRGLSLSELVKKARRIIPDIKGFHKSFENDSSKFIQNYNYVNGIDTKVAPNFTISQIEDAIGSNIFDRINIPKNLSSEVSMKLKIDETSITVKNMIVENQVLYYAITSYEHYKTLRSIELVNCGCPQSLLEMLIEICAILSPQLESITLHNLDLSGRPVESLAAALLPSVRSLRTLSVSKCRLTAKDVGDLITGIIRGQSVEQVDLSSNGIDDFGAKFIGTLIRYYDPLKRIDASLNDFNVDAVKDIDKMANASKRNTVLKYVV